MSCIQTLNGLARDCDGNMGGIVEVMIANFDDVTAKTLTDGKISAISMASSTYFHSYYFPKNTGNLTSTYNLDPAAGVRYVTSQLLLQFNRMETTKRVEMTALAIGDLAVIVKDANGKYWYLGYDFPVSATAATAETGTASSDFNGYKVTLTDTSAEFPFEVPAEAIKSLIQTAPAV